MTVWIVFWGIIILFSLVAFTIMSAKILIKGVGELKEMFHMLKNNINYKQYFLYLNDIII